MFKPVFRLMLGVTLVAGLTGCPDNENEGDDDNDRDYGQLQDSSRFENDGENNREGFRYGENGGD